MIFLGEWFRRHCDGDWEHQYGITLSTLDNPGWRLRVDLIETDLEGRLSERHRDERSEHDWLDYRSDGRVFEVACGPDALERAIEAFREFAN